jgi:glycosyltransferase involved in cell wall biosynthesis
VIGRSLRGWLGARPRARVAINLAPRRGPYGGGNQFVRQLTDHLRATGYAVTSGLDEGTDCALVVDARPELATFGVDDVAQLKRLRPGLVCVHRVNECDARKGTAHMDALLARANGVADHTVFVSAWLRDYHVERWFDRGRPHSVIVPGADPRVFHPLGPRPPDGTFRVGTHHWSDHPMKGFAAYAEVDRLIARGELAGFELRVIGRWPAGMTWQAARLVGPLSGTRLADELRQCHAYVTASLWEPGAMHVAEAAQCGLPVAYHEDGGGTVEVARHFGVPFSADVGAAVRRLRDEYASLRARVLAGAPAGDRLCLEDRRLVERLLATRTDALQ